MEVPLRPSVGFIVIIMEPNVPLRPGYETYWNVDSTSHFNNYKNCMYVFLFVVESRKLIIGQRFGAEIQNILISYTIMVHQL